MNEKFKGVVFHFPTSRIDMVRSGGEFNPAKIEDSDLQVAALKVADSGTSIDRKLLTPKANKLLPQIVTAAKGEASEVEEKLVVDVILAELMKMQFLPRHSGEKGKKFTANLRGRVERFVELVPVKPWTEKSIGSAVGLLGTVVRDAMRKVSEARVPKRALKPVELPVTRTITLPATEVIDRGESFEKWKFFFEYRRGLFPVAKFDAGSTEYAIADFLEASDEVTWWKRIYDEDDASFAYEFEGSLHKYQPDFVVFEAETKTYWVVEGKSSAEIDSAQVQAKAKAARETLNMTPGEVFWPDMRWRYLIVDEKNLKSSDGWDDVKRFA
jgi:type III restriction enzyme